ncbi:hypothetical protein [Amycolatopsis sp. WQ 127309]|uniref:hypothetical protein n=1 Tax=Amycolatopsis sp. WQ 127309 TaxID=2932773 RepID=UPI001FF52589|nr:hypothetical protein [Amycolatopsis sp. WQ 127309]UOZ10197.1 hypothetical protein MUY22_18820 [Amycolatopsis sp. WQ 127309]
MTGATRLDLIIVILGFILGGFINWLAKPAKLTNKVLIVLICVTLSVVAVLTVLKDEPSTGEQNVALVECPRLFDEAHELLIHQSQLAAPPVAGSAFTSSQELAGRVDLTVSWVNPTPLTQAAIAIEGVYGTNESGDDYIDHRQPAAAPGQCWNWYHFATRDDAQPAKVHFRVSALWPGQTYCFYTSFRIDTGYSKPTDIRCEKASWKPEWGKPAAVPGR